MQVIGMKFDFQQMKPVIQQEFDEIFDSYPTNLDFIREKIPAGGDPIERKRIILELASSQCPVHIFPHYPFAFEMDMGEERDVTYYGVGNESRFRCGVDFSALRAFSELSGRIAVCFLSNYSDHIHRTLDHQLLLSSGFRGVYERCEALNRVESDPEKKRWRELVMHCCKCVERIGLRLRERAKEILPFAGDEDARYNLNRIIHSVNTPWEAPQTYFDAMNSVLCASLFISGLDGVEMNCQGRVDQWLFPFYERDMQNGVLTEEEAYFLLQCYLQKTDMHCHFNEKRKTYDNGVSAMIGGVDEKGEIVYNEITRMMIRAYEENKLLNPKLNSRACEKSPREYMEKLAALMMKGNNNLVVQNDDYIIPMFQKMGLSYEDAATYVGNGCQEVICANQLHSRAFIYINLPIILLHTMQYDAETLPEELKIIYRYGSFRKENYQALHDSFLLNLRSYVRVMAEVFYPYEEKHAFINLEPMLSSFTADCVEKGVDMAAGGARYNHKTLSLNGFGTLCDSLINLEEAYREGWQEELFGAVFTDFEGHEPLRQKLLHQPHRFGHSEEGDAFAKALADELAHVTKGVINAQGIEWGTSLFTHYRFALLGRKTGATPDGRKAQEPLSRQMNMADMPELTAAALSMAALSEADFHDVGMFDIALPFTVEGEHTHQALTDYIRTCMALKLPVLQVNVADAKTMKEERAKKGTHPDLIVRVCGYSAIFGALDEKMQDEIISRTEKA